MTKKWIYQGYVLLWLLCLSFNIQAAFFSSVKRYSIDDGLPVSTIFTLLKDQSGYFWLGTPEGLVRYDGYDFETYTQGGRNHIQLVTPDAGNIFIDSRQRLWIGSWGKGVALYNSSLELINHFQHDSNNPNSIGSNLAQAFFEDSRGRIWIGTNGGGLALYREGTQDFMVYPADANRGDSLSHSRVWSITETIDGTIWVGTGNGLNKMIDETRGRFEHFTHEPGNATSIDHPLVRTLMVDEQNQIWLGTEKGFGLFDHKTETFKSFNLNGEQFNATITKLRTGGLGIIWVGTQKGLYRFESDKQQFTPLVNDSNYALLPHDDIRDIYVDTSENIWIATRYTGLTRINLAPSIFENYRKYRSKEGEMKSLERVFDLVEDKEGVVWIASSSGLLTLTNNGIEQAPIDSLDGKSIYSIAINSSGHIWLGSELGLGVLSKNRDHYITKNNILNDNPNIIVNKLLFDHDNYLWIATVQNGLFRFDGRKTDVYIHDPNNPNSLSENNITTLYEDDQNRLWIGTLGSGANRLDPERNHFFHYQYSSIIKGSLGFGPINSIHQTNDGTIWIGTNSSLNKLIDITDTFEQFSSKEGMASSSVKVILADQYGDIWLSTNAGLTQFKLSNDFFVNHDQRDFINNNKLLNGAGLNSQTHGLLFGSELGLVRVHSDNQLFESNVYKPQITNVWIDGKRYPKYNFNDTEVLDLNHSVKNIRIRFSALNFTEESQNQYSHRIIGFNETWSPMEVDNQVNFSGLDSGYYTFEIQSNISWDRWHDTPTALHINIRTAWWRQPILYIVIVLILLLSSFLFHKARTLTLARQKEVLERQISSRSKQLLDAQKRLIESEKNASLSGLVAGVAHEINTPVGISVTASSNLIERANTLLTAFKNNRIKKSEFEAQIVNIKMSAEMVLYNLGRASDLIRSFKEVSVDQISQQRRRFDMKEYLEEVLMSLTPKLRIANIETEIECPEKLIVDSYPGAIAQLITNLVMNAILHAFEDREEGLIRIIISAKKDDKESLYLRFTDNGKGIPKDAQPKIFEPFFTTKRGKGGSGLGLQIINNIVTFRLGGTISCESELNVGTTFNIEFLKTPP